MDKQLSAKQKNCVLRNIVIQKKAKDVDKGLASERNECEKRMNVEAKKILKRFTKTAKIKQDSDERRYEHLARHPSPKLPGLPIIRHPAEESRSGEDPLPRSAPVSPSLQKRALQQLSHDGAKVTHSLVPPEQQLSGIRRGSCPYMEKSNQLGVPKTSRRGSSGSVGIRAALDQADPISPKMARNLAMRERARRGGSLKDLELAQGEVDTKTKPSLEEQFQALGSCRYLRDRANSYT